MMRLLVLALIVGAAVVVYGGNCFGIPAARLQASLQGRWQVTSASDSYYRKGLPTTLDFRSNGVLRYATRGNFVTDQAGHYAVHVTRRLLRQRQQVELRLAGGPSNDYQFNVSVADDRLVLTDWRWVGEDPPPDVPQATFARSGVALQAHSQMPSGKRAEVPGDPMGPSEPLAQREECQCASQVTH